MSGGERNLPFGWLARPLEWFVILVMAVLVLDVLWGVVSRYVLGEQTRWTEELARFLLIWVSLLGVPLVFREHGHLGVDYFVGKLEAGARRLASMAVEVAIFVFAAWAMVGGGWVLVAKTLESGQVSPALGLPVGVVYLATPISGMFICLFSLGHMRDIARGRSTDAEERPSEERPIDI